MGQAHKLEHCPGAGALFPQKLHCLFCPSEYRTGKWLSSSFGEPADLVTMASKTGSVIVESKVARFSTEADRFLVEKQFCILFEDARVLLFQFGPHPTHD